MKNNYLSFFLFILLCSLLCGCDKKEEEFWMYEVREDGNFNFSSVLLEDYGVTVTLDSNGGIYQMVVVDWRRDSWQRRFFFKGMIFLDTIFAIIPQKNANITHL